ncbi:unnamed protein product [Dicrocoelium dendriticum]|nr:unnamed protein product [Dicrocoelium dendriticum]
MKDDNGNVPDRHSSKKLPSSLSLLDQNQFNLNSLLKSGAFYIDELGILVAPNGTRFRLPSGPPEGRKPLRPDRPITKLENYTSLFVERQLSEQQDATKHAVASFGHNTQIYNGIPNHDILQKVNATARTTHQLNSHNRLQPLATYPQPDVVLFPLQPIEWNIILMTLVFCSVSLACNLVLIGLISWRLYRARKKKSGSNFHLEITSGKVDACARSQVIDAREICPFELEGTIKGGIGIMSKPMDRIYHSFSPCYQTRQRSADIYASSFVRRECQSERHRCCKEGHLNSKKVRINKIPGKQVPEITKGFAAHDRESESDKSWKVVLSDGAISENTGDEAETTDSGNNSDNLLHIRRYHLNPRYIKAKKHIPSRCHPYEADSVINANQSKLAACAVRSIGSTHRNTDEDDHGTDSQSTTTSTCAFEWVNSSYVYNTLVIHTGILGVVLSLMQLVAVCIALRQRMTQPQSSTGLIEFVCILSTSLAADTILCSRQYLLAAILAVFWESVSALLLPCLCQTRRLPALRIFPFNSGEKYSADQCTTGAFRNCEDCSKQKCQQSYACLALLHSLPWALAAGTSLIITFAIYGHKMRDPPPSSLHSESVKLNVFFGGLNSILHCRAPEHLNRTSIVTTYSSQNGNEIVTTLKQATSSTEAWVPMFLMILLPLLLQILVCLFFSILLRRSAKRNITTGSTCENKDTACVSLCAVFVLLFTEFFSCAIPVIWSTAIKNLLQFPVVSAYISRLIVIHLLFDPWLLMCMQHTMLRHAVKTFHTAIAEPQTPKISTSQYSLTAHSEHPSQNFDLKDTLASHICHNDDQIQDGPQAPVGLLSCCPQTQNVGACSQPILNSRVPGNGLFISQGLAKTFTAGTNTTGLLFPISTNCNTINVSQEVSDSSTTSGGLAPVKNTLGQMPKLSNLAEHSTKVNQPSFPLLCQHHQRLLEKHYQQQPRMTGSPVHLRRLPRILTTNTTGETPLHNSLSIQPVYANTANKYSTFSFATIGHSLPQTNDDLSEQDCFNRMQHTSFSGKSTATAAVMAAAAAAVAAQASTLNHRHNSAKTELIDSPTTSTFASDSLTLLTETKWTPNDENPKVILDHLHLQQPV